MSCSKSRSTTKPYLESTAMATNHFVDSDEFESLRSMMPKEIPANFHHTKDESSESGDSTNTKRVVTKSLLEQQCRHAAMLRLEEFFLGEVVTKFCEHTESSPVSVLDASLCSSERKSKPARSLKKIMDSRSPPSSPARNIFGEIMERPNEPVQRIPATSSMEESDMPLFTNTGLFLDDGDDGDIVTQCHANENKAPSMQAFVKLRSNDRANSLPIECMATSNNSRSSRSPRISGLPLTKKPSLKKMSSKGQYMTSHKSDSNLLQRTVSFSSLSIREYPPALSDNPSCSFGPPVQLDWDHEAEATHQIDHYEEARKPRRDPHDLLLSYYDRRFLLKHAGCSKREVKDAMKEIERVKRERMVTDLFLPAQAFDETVEKLVDTVKGFFQVRETEALPKTQY